MNICSIEHHFNLESENKQLKDEHGTCSLIEQERNRLKDDVARLREALEKIALDMVRMESRAEDFASYEPSKVAKIAKEALRGGGE